MELKDFKDQLTRIDSKLSELLKEKRQPKELWVTASVITSRTLWSNEDMRRARENGWVKFKKIKNITAK
jgi:hypothetical protein